MITRHIKWIAWLSGILTLLLVAFSFILSFRNLVELAEENGIAIPYLFPLVVEFAVIVFSVGVLRKTLEGETPIVGWALVIGSSALATYFNVLHAGETVTSRLMHAVPSVFMLLSFETFLGQIKSAIKHAGAAQTAAELTQQCQALNTQAATKQHELDTLQRQVEQAREQLQHFRLETKPVQNTSVEQARRAKSQNDEVTIEQRRQALTAILKNEGDLGVTVLASRLNVTRGTVYNDLHALKKAGVVIKNGHGWEMV